MEGLTFGEQVKIILGRKGMTIKELAEIIEERTGQKMSRQNLTQRLGRDNFQEQDMRRIAEILGCPFHLSILSGEFLGQSKYVEAVQAAGPSEQELEKIEQKRRQKAALSNHEDTEDKKAESSNECEERDMTIGELYEIHEELSELEKKEEPKEGKKEKFLTGGIFLRKKANPALEPEVKASSEEVAETIKEPEPADELPQDNGNSDREPEDFEPVIKYEDAAEDRDQGEVNPYTGKEYQSNSVRMHPTRIGYVQVYDRSVHRWTDMTEWAFLGYQERKKALLGKAYEPPIYLD